MKIAFVLDTMIFGGIERVAINYLNILINQEHEIDVIILNPKIEDIVKEIPEKCNVIYKDFSKVLCPEAYWTLVKKHSLGKYVFPVLYLVLFTLTPIIKLIKGRRTKYDCAIAFSGHYNDLTYVTSYIYAKKRFCWLHGSVADYLLSSPGYYFLYKKIKNLIVLSEDYQENAIISNKMDDCNITKLYNPVSISTKLLNNEKVESLKKMHGDFILMVGRFSVQKDQKTVVDAIKILKIKYEKSIKILFVGDGPTRKAVESYAAQCGVSDLIVFEGTKSDVQNYYHASKMLVHSSPTEGLPTVILEAMSVGLPIVATDSKPGVREILGENNFGLISPVKDAEAMAANIIKLLTDDRLYRDCIQRGYQRVLDFKPEIISEQFKKILID